MTDSPRWFPFEFGAADSLGFLELSREDYDTAAFLDRRMIRPGMQGHRIAWSDAIASAQPLPRRCHFLFHISHVGSTLLSRLLGLHPNLFSVREPLLLRSFAALGVLPSQETANRLETLLALWSRTWTVQQTAVIKATSFVNEIAAHLMMRVPESRAILMTVSPQTFLRALLGGAMSDITDQAEPRWNRLTARVPELASKPQSPGEMTAMSWLCETLSLDAAARSAPERVLWLDFDDYLEQPTLHLKQAFQHLKINVDDATVAAILANPLAGAYSKSTVYRFDHHVRRGILSANAVTHAREIRAGLTWLERSAALSATVAAVMPEATGH